MPSRRTFAPAILGRHSLEGTFASPSRLRSVPNAARLAWATPLTHFLLRMTSLSGKLLAARILIAKRLVNFGFRKPLEIFCRRDQA